MLAFHQAVSPMSTLAQLHVKMLNLHVSAVPTSTCQHATKWEVLSHSPPGPHTEKYWFSQVNISDFCVFYTLYHQVDLFSVQVTTLVQFHNSQILLLIIIEMSTDVRHVYSYTNSCQTEYLQNTEVINCLLYFPEDNTAIFLQHVASPNDEKSS